MNSAEMGGKEPENPNTFANRVRIARRSQIESARSNLALSRELKFRSFFKINAAETLEEKKQFGDDYKRGVVGVIDAAVLIGDEKVREKKQLEDIPQEITARTNSIKLALEIQLERDVDQTAIRSIIEELGLKIDREILIDRIKEAVRINSEEIDREVVKKAVKVTDRSVSMVRKIQKRMGVKEDPSEYEQSQPS